MPRIATAAIGRNMAAFLDTLAMSEIGPQMLKASDDGYNIVVGSIPGKLDLFTSYATHPNKKVYLPKMDVYSTAAGRYQILARYFQVYKVQLSLPDFGPIAQDQIALQLIKECKATAAISAGNITEALKLCKSRWASLPGAGYGQPEHKLETLLAYYTAAGGVLAKGQ